MTTLPVRVGVFGGGRMGAGIAHAFLTAGSEVVLVEAGPDAASAARTRVEVSLTASSRRGLLQAGVDSHLERLRVVVDSQELAGSGLVIEAVPEDPRIKADVLAHIESVVAPDAVVASNTSSLSIDGMAKDLLHPERFLGYHFFNPVPASKLVEIVVGSQTDAMVVKRAQQWVTELDKTAVTVKDAPGFASSRLGVAIALEAMRMVDEGIASVEDIDAAMTLGYRHPVGPLRTTDIVGLDVRLAIAEHLERELGPRFAPPQVLRDKVAAGDLGKKTGRGFYDW